ncbi:hypothetical protein SAMN05421821_11963 [Mucilaginibacter lappiensis]|uniref:Lipoprotein n=1 Tax=Mucilaginibacter lappiensis TaxID=354630 RepID=A0ABR6PSI3_9SPHI|nr:hypothetical protein [Mucilaginibacter lappiensis]MBB6112528.1 hypothetical protein [Mucilaginibacter lappiensis]SIS02749.1 hypothetical protein SAMN05421821_11963 [Mucilaginibacter lappiensis]
MKKVLLLASLTGLMLSSCSKKSDTPAKPQTPISKAIDAKYIHDGADENSLVVEYSSFNANADCDKTVYQAAVETVQGGSGINNVTVVGANLTMVFTRGALAQPATTSLTYGTSLYKTVTQNWSWSGYLTIKKQNTSLTSDQFNKAISVKVNAVNTGDVAAISSKTIAGDFMNVEYALTKIGSLNSQFLSYEVQASTPITLTSQYQVSCLIPGFVSPQSIVVLDISKVSPTVQQKDLGGGVTSYTQTLDYNGVSKSLSQYIAGRYFVEKVYPIVK